MAQRQIEDSLSQLNLHLLEDTNTPEKQPYSFDNPHSCRHCEDESIQVREELASLACRHCIWSGVPAIESPDYGSCGGCGRSNKEHGNRWYSATLKYGIDDAMAAARSGCALYGHVLRSLTKFGTKDLEVARSLPSSERFRLFGYSGFENREASTCAVNLSFGTKPNDLDIPSGSMRPWTRADDRASKYISARPYEHDIDCEATWNFARSCFYACKEKHGRCRGRLTESFDTQWRRSRADLDGESVAIDDVPSRLLDVHPEDEPKVKMVEVHDMTDAEKALVCSLGFAALSYCWGGQQSLVLTKEQDRHLRGGLAISRLPKTIQDAIKTVRKLRLRYLWVDALCIYQDDDQDKAAEISRMETYYGSAAVTICAAIASSSEQGFLFRRESTPFGVGPIRVPLVNEEGINQGHLYLLKEAEAPPEPTTTRGWTMQESLLSRRILIYAARQLYWCCNTSIAGCGGEHMEFLDKISGNLYSLVDNIHPIGSIIEQPIAGQWDYLVMDYTARHLGVPGDKLLAVSALVSHLLELAKERGQKFVYAAGLLIDMENDNSWANQLQWHTLDPQRSRRVSSYRAPSWSWAAVDGPISPNEDLVILGRGNMARVESHAVDVVYQHLPFGSVRGGYVVVQKKKRRISECTGFPGLPLVIRGTRLADYQGRDGARSRMELLPDTEEDCKRIDDLISEGAREKGQIFLLLLQSNKLVRGSKGLIVSPAGMDNMARIGLFLVHQRDSSATFDASTIFRDCPVGSVRLV